MNLRFLAHTLSKAILSAAMAFAALTGSAAYGEPANDDIATIATTIAELKAEGTLPGVQPHDRFEELSIDPQRNVTGKEWFKKMAPDVAGSRLFYVASITIKGSKLKYLFRTEKPDEVASAYLFNGTSWDKISLSDSLERNLTETDKDGFKYLFNGKDLTGWDGDNKYWSALGGALAGRIKPGYSTPRVNSFLIWTNGIVDDFEMRFSFRFPSDVLIPYGNSGVQYRSVITDRTNWVVCGYQADMLAGTNHTGMLFDEGHITGGRSVIADRGEKVAWSKDCRKQLLGSLGTIDEIQAAFRYRQWNDYTIIARGNHLQHFINGKQIVDVIDDCQHKLDSGVVAIQLRGDRAMTVLLKDIRLKSLK